MGTQAECSFIQHSDNVMHNGTALVASVTISSGLVAAQVTNACGPWPIGKDAKGVAVLINAQTGEVRSHGTVHAGMPISSLPTSLPLPLRY